MIALLITLVLVIGGFIAVAVGKIHSTEFDSDISLRPAGLIAILIGFLVLVPASCSVIDPGHAGVPVTLGSAGSPLGSGVHFLNPLTSVKSVNVQTQVYVLVANPTEGNQGDDSVEVRGSDQATGKVNARLNWHQNQGSATTIYKRYGGDVEARVVRPVTRSCLNDAAIGRTLAENASTARGAFEHDAAECIDRQFTKAGIVFDDLSIAEITLPHDVQKAVNAKAASFSELAARQNRAQGARIEALGQSDSQQIIKCGGVGQKLDNGTTTIKPNANADGSCKGASRLSSDYLTYLYIQALSRNAGSKNHTLFVVPPGTDVNAIISDGHN